MIQLRFLLGLVVFAAFLVAGAVACGGGGGPPAATPSPTLAPTPAPSPTPIVEAIPEGWERHTTANIQIDFPETWAAFDPSEETSETIKMTLEEVLGFKPDSAQIEEIETEIEGLVTRIEDILPQADLVAVDKESLNFFFIFRQTGEEPFTVPTYIAGYEELLPTQGFTVLASDSSLTIGGSRAGSMQTQDLDQNFNSWYIVLAEPTFAFILVFAATADEPVFEQIAQSFRVLEAP